MEINNILLDLDQYYQNNEMGKAYEFLLEQLHIAMQLQRDDIVLPLLSELIGYYRVTSQYELGSQIAHQALKIIEYHQLQETIAGATTYLNIATLYRAQGQYQAALKYYHKTEQIYASLLDENDERYASFYNNVSLLYQELSQYEQALKYEWKALSIIQTLPDCEIEQAITYTNLSQIYFIISHQSKAKECLYHAIALFEEYGPQDPHYFAALASLAHLYGLQQRYEESLDLYDQVLEGIERTFGKNKDYYIVLDNKKKVQDNMRSINGMTLCRMYYDSYGKPMLEEKFPHLLQYMAIGMCGLGSDCLGYDDDMSRDHDFGPGFCIWLPQDVFSIYGQQIQKAYDQLPREFMGYQRQTSLHGDGRVGVFCIDDFFLSFIEHMPETLNDWLYIDENGLISCTNGQIFEDNYGAVSKLREYLHFYPEDIRKKKIAKSLAKMAQSGQYNYSRCMQRHDVVASSLALAEFVNETLSVVYLLNYRYKPYYKWSYHGLKDCQRLKDIGKLLKELILLPDQGEHYHKQKGLVLDDPKVIIIEKICQKIIYELHHQNLTNHYADFLDYHALSVMETIDDLQIRQKHVMEG